MRREPADIDGTSAPTRSPEVLTAELDGEAVLYDPRTGAAMVLNATATLVWRSLDSGASLESVARRLSQRFDTDLDQVRSEVVEVVRGFGRNGLLEGAELAPDDGGDAAPAGDG